MKLITLLSLMIFCLSNPYILAQHRDAKADSIASRIIKNAGGKKAWDETRFIRWNFFGRRWLLWDKFTGDVRIDFLTRPLTVTGNVHLGLYRVFIDSVESDNKDTITKYSDLAYKVWINDSYWLCMPFKMFDPGVNLRYIGKKPSHTETEAEVIEMTFDDVGVTPQNKYMVYVDPESARIIQWEYYARRENESPDLWSPWMNYQKYGNIWLSSDRGEGRQLSGIEVFNKLPAKPDFDIKGLR
jgi:hypothetical protein